MSGTTFSLYRSSVHRSTFQQGPHLPCQLLILPICTPSPQQSQNIQKKRSGAWYSCVQCMLLCLDINHFQACVDMGKAGFQILFSPPSFYRSSILLVYLILHNGLSICFVITLFYLTCTFKANAESSDSILGVDKALHSAIWIEFLIQNLKVFTSP